VNIQSLESLKGPHELGDLEFKGENLSANSVDYLSPCHGNLFNTVAMKFPQVTKYEGVKMLRDRQEQSLAEGPGG